MTIKTTKQIPNFPTFGLLPKEETEAAAFLKKYPEYDGRNTVIAILDTGVDPGAVGLQTTTEGKPKIIDLIDCTGSGDVITKTVVKPTIKNDNGETLHVIQGLSGRQLIINPKWNNPSEEFRVGIKRAYDLFPEQLVSRLQQEHRESFETKHHKLQAEVQKAISAWEEAHPPGSSPSESDVLIKTDLDARLEVLKDFLKNYEDPGLILDVVTFFDGTNWRAVVDVNESGDLRDAPTLTNFRNEQQYHTFSQEDLLNFSVNIYDEGNVVSIVIPAGSHGTHVAAITAAYHKDEPELNGVAPGAQVISLKIGDTRLGSLETGAALTRAAIALVDTKADLANMSYGEASAIPNFGYFVDLMRDEVIGKHGCIFTSSAGNNGPALTTTGSPGGTTSGIIGVGAYVSHAMVQAEYALLESVPERPYTWTSRGPCTDGDPGVDIYAPGGAITSVPLYSLQKTQLMNGTSMSSPNACGCIALLLSGLKAENKEYTPYRIKNAIVHSAKSIDDPFGVGFIQVEKAWNYIQTYYDRFDQDLSFEITVLSKPRDKRGIYLREWYETSTAQIFNVDIDPKFMSEFESGENNTKKFEFESRVALISTESWVRAPEFLLFSSQGRGFQVKVDATQLTPGKFYYAEVQGYDTSASLPVPLFKVPVTVTKPQILTNSAKYSLNSLSFGPGHIERHFVKVPEGATFADVVLRFSITDSTRFCLHMIQILPQSRYTKFEREYYFPLTKGSYDDANGEQVEKKRFSVCGGVTLEVCLAQYWSSLGNNSASLEITFHGIQLANNTANGDNLVYIHGSDAYTRLDAVAPVRKEDEINPSLSFDTLRKSLRPTEYSIRPLSQERDVLPNSRQIHGLQLTYTFKTTENNASVTPRFTAFFDYLYDAHFDDFFAIVFDANKKPVGYFAIYPNSLKLEVKGDYTIRAQLRHDSLELLEKLSNTVCSLDISLSKSKDLEIYAKLPDVFTSKKQTFGKTSLDKGHRKALFVASPVDYSTFPKDAKVGDLLVGNLNFVNSPKVDGGQYKVIFMIPPAPVKTKELTASSESGITSEKSKDDTISQQLVESIRDTQLAHLRKFPVESTARAELLAELESKHPTHLPLYQTKLELLLETGNGNLTSEIAARVIEAADQILENVDLTELATYYGVKQDTVTEAAKKKKKEADDKKKAVFVALRSKTQALAVLSDSASITTVSLSSTDDFARQFEETYQSLQQWLDSTPPTNDFKALLAYITRERRALRYGNSIKAINKFLAEQGLTKETIKEVEKATQLRRDLLSEAGWDIWAKHEERWKLIHAPPCGFAPF